MRFGQQLKTLRLEKGLTQEDLADATGLSLSFIRSVEQGIHAPSFESIEILARVLSISEKDLFSFDKD